MPERNDKPIRFRKARSDASIGTIEKTIEEKLGLPAGSVEIKNPNRKNARSDKKLGKLKKDYNSKLSEDNK